jgi:hypothetical protein
VSPIAVACRWSLLLLSRLLSAQAMFDSYQDASTITAAEKQAASA